VSNEGPIRRFLKGEKIFDRDEMKFMNRLQALVPPGFIPAPAQRTRNLVILDFYFRGTAAEADEYAEQLKSQVSGDARVSAPRVEVTQE
jgi:hypothetical protein